MECLYHYSSNEKTYSILANKNIRMSDIGKSNDTAELALFFPKLHHMIFRKYTENPFPFKHYSRTDTDAMYNLVWVSEQMWRKRFDEGDFANFVLCLTERKDSLSQWRGYADDGRGCCIGFSKETLKQYCDATNGVLRFEKVVYVTEEKILELIDILAEGILLELRNLRNKIVENTTHDDNNIETDHFLRYNFEEMLEKAFTDSLRLKAMPFFDENEWRIFFARQAYKNADWVLNKKTEIRGQNLFDKTLAFLNDRIDFRYTSNDLVPFCPISFNEFPQIPVVELWLGPKNCAHKSDVSLFLRKYDYYGVEIFYSQITYR